MPAVVLPPLSRPVYELWHVLLDLGETSKVHWTLIGSQMVLLHALAHGQVPPQISQDGDVIAARARAHRTGDGDPQGRSGRVRRQGQAAYAILTERS